MKRRDIVLIAALLIVSVAMLIIVKTIGKEGSYAVVAVEGVEISRYSLLSDGLFQLNGGTNILEIQDGRARLIDADCPDRLCVRQGWIKFTGQVITCLPNKLTVTIIGGDDSVDFVL